MEVGQVRLLPGVGAVHQVGQVRGAVHQVPRSRTPLKTDDMRQTGLETDDTRTPAETHHTTTPREIDHSNFLFLPTNRISQRHVHTQRCLETHHTGRPTLTSRIKRIDFK